MFERLLKTLSGKQHVTQISSFSNVTARVSVLITLLRLDDCHYNSLPAGSFSQLCPCFVIRHICGTILRFWGKDCMQTLKWNSNCFKQTIELCNMLQSNWFVNKCNRHANQIVAFLLWFCGPANVQRYPCQSSVGETRTFINFCL